MPRATALTNGAAPPRPDQLTPAVIKKLLEEIEVPACKCKVKYVPCCIVREGPRGCSERRMPCCVKTGRPDGCKDYQRGRTCRHRPCNRCTCAWLPGPPCPHIRAKWHSLSLDDWAELLEKWGRLLDKDAGDGYDEPPPPPCPMLVASEEARVLIMIERASRGYGLHHPLDLWRDGNGDRLKCGPLAEHAANGAMLKDGMEYGADGEVYRTRIVTEAPSAAKERRA